MPTVETLVRRTSYLIDDNIVADIAIDLFNEALEEIDTIYGQGKRLVTPLAIDSNTITLPSDLLDITRVIVKTDDEKGENKYEAKSESMNNMDNYSGIEYPDEYYSYNIFGNEMKIFPIPKKPVEVTIEYYGGNEKIPSTDVDPSLKYVPKIPERYHRALPLFAASRYFENWEDNPEQRNNFRKQFERIRDDMAYHYERKTRNAKSKKVYITRGWY